MAEQGRTDFYVSGDMFVYYSVEQAWAVKKGRRYFRGPDVFWVGGVDRHRAQGMGVVGGGRPASGRHHRAAIPFDRGGAGLLYPSQSKLSKS